MRLVYNSNIKTRLDFRVAVVDKFAQKSIDVYRGFVQVFGLNFEDETRPRPTIKAPNKQQTDLPLWMTSTAFGSTGNGADGKDDDARARGRRGSTAGTVSGRKV